jgi:hypothetical protein
MGGEPTIWAWLAFWVQIALAVYAFFVFVADRVPGLAGVGAVVRKASWKLLMIFIQRWGDWLICYIYGPLWRTIISLPRTLWSGPPPPPEAAPVSRLSVPLPGALPGAYVVPEALSTPQNAPFAPSAVRPSAPSAPVEPPAPPAPAAVERLTVDRSREALIEALLAAGWSATQIREQLRGANATTGQEIEAARARLAEASAPRATPLARRALADGVAFREPAP